MVARERERFTAYSDRMQGRNLLEDLLQEEVRRRERIVAIDREAVAIAPFASRVPFQVQLIPRRPRPRFEDDGALGAALLHDVIGRLGRVLGALPPLNMWVRTAPAGAEYFCWRIDILPRLTHLAGLELGTGVNLNVMPPELAAERLRSAFLEDFGLRTWAQALLNWGVSDPRVTVSIPATDQRPHATDNCAVGRARRFDAAARDRVAALAGRR